MREPNHADAELAIKLYDLRREHELRKARRLVGELSMASWEKVQEVMDWENDRNAHFRQATSYWEMCASFVNRGVFHPDVYLDTCSEGLFTFVGLKPHMAKIRETNPRFMTQTERVVAEHPALRERVDMMDKMMAAWRAEQAAADAKAAKKKDKKKGKK
jgi:hypothetical protein